jgi:hypothetical protein
MHTTTLQLQPVHSQRPPRSPIDNEGSVGNNTIKQRVPGGLGCGQGPNPTLAPARHGGGRAISRVRVALVLCCVLFGSCAHRALVWVPEPENLVCRVDSDCAIATEVGCCDCQVQPYAVSRSKEEERLGYCSVALCVCQGTCLCPPIADPGQFRAACERNRCVQRPSAR